jgi:hypothetical protein
MLKLFELVLAVLGSWDIVRRLLPVHVPVVLGKLACLGLGAALLKWASPTILLALCVPGGLMVLAIILSPEPHTPWGPYVTEAVRLFRRRRSGDMREARLVAPRIGNRVPRL